MVKAADPFMVTIQIVDGDAFIVVAMVCLISLQLLTLFILSE